MPRYHGFTCPNCGSHYFGTHTYHQTMGEKFLQGTSVGECRQHQHTGNGCMFQWNRDDPEQENKCMYTQTESEWMAAHNKEIQS